MKPLPREFYSRSTVKVAKELIGKTLVRQINGRTIAGIISETEAYTDRDPASHSFRGQTARNSAMFGPPGHAYVYFIYGNHFCLNAVAKRGKSGAVLIRGILGTEGPGRLTKRFGINRRLDGIDLTKKGELFIAGGERFPITATPRIGITKAKEKKWRFLIRTSKPRRAAC